MKPCFFRIARKFFAIGLATFSLQYYYSLDCNVNFNVGKLSLCKQKVRLTRLRCIRATLLFLVKIVIKAYSYSLMYVRNQTNSAYK